MSAGTGGDGFKVCGTGGDGTKISSPCRPLISSSAMLTVSATLAVAGHFEHAL